MIQKAIKPHLDSFYFEKESDRIKVTFNSGGVGGWCHITMEEIERLPDSVEEALKEEG